MLKGNADVANKIPPIRCSDTLTDSTANAVLRSFLRGELMKPSEPRDGLGSARPVTDKGTWTSRDEESIVPTQGAFTGPPTVPLDQVHAMLMEVEAAHKILDALDLPPGTLTERLVVRAQRWLHKVPANSQTHPAREARIILREAGVLFWDADNPPEVK
jgi:hypothetical protein